MMAGSFCAFISGRRGARVNLEMGCFDTVIPFAFFRFLQVLKQVDVENFRHGIL
jgi:hypothetical protein